MRGKEIQANKSRVYELYDWKCANWAEPVKHWGTMGQHHIVFRRDNMKNYYNTAIEKEGKANRIVLCQACELRTHTLAGEGDY